MYYGSNMAAYNNLNGDLIIPDSVVYNGTAYPITTIGHHAFMLCTGLTSVSLGNNITTIENSAFLGCSNMGTINIPNSVSTVGYSPFSGCTGLLVPVYNNNIFIYLNEDFNGSYTIPYGITRIHSAAFHSCQGLSSVSIPNTVDSIGTHAFYSCTNLHEILIPSSVTAIGAWAFANSGIDTIRLAGLPPIISFGPHSELSTNTEIIVSCGRSNLFRIAPGWNLFNNISEENLYAIHIEESNNGTAGILINPTCYTSAQIFAIPNANYLFTMWSDGNTDNPRSLYITQDTTLTAYFELSTNDTIHDTTYISVHDTIISYVTVHDTIIAYINVPVHDTIYLPQYIYDTLWLHDTIIIHDTVYITREGIDCTDTISAKVYSCQSQIVVEGANGNIVTLYDATGRILSTKQDYGTPLQFDIPASGAYMIMIGNCPARKVVVIRR